VKKKIHIDELFKDGLKDLSFLVSSKDFEAIEQKKSVFDDSSANQGPLFEDFELEINDEDWVKTWSKLQTQKQFIDQRDAFKTRLSALSIEPDPLDWPITFDKYKAVKRRRRIWWYAASSLFIVFSVGVMLLLNTLGFNTSVKALSHKAVKPSPTAVLSAPSSVQANSQASAQTNSSNSTATFTQIGSSIGSSNFQAPTAELQSRAISSGSNSLNHGMRHTASQLPNANLPMVIAQTISQAEAPVLIAEEAQLVFPLQGIAYMPTANAEMPQFLSLLQTLQTLPALTKLPIMPPIKWQKYLAVNQSVAINNSMLRTGDTAYKALNKASHANSIQYTSGIEFGCMKSNKQFSIGLNHVSQEENAHYHYQYKVYDSIPVWNPGRTQIVGYFLLHPRDTMIDQSTHIVRQHIQVPFKLSAFTKLSKKTALGFEFGGNVLYQYASKGTAIMNPENKQLYPYVHFKDQEQKWQVAPRIGISVQQQLTKQFVLQTALFGQFSLSNQFKQSYPVGQYNYQYGLNLKLLYLLK
jgi:hypothetical protein